MSDAQRVLADEITVEAFVGGLLRWRRLIGWLGVAGAFVGLGTGVFRARVYESGATFIPQSNTPSLAGAAGLAAAASQFGLQVPLGKTDVWGPLVYMELLQSRDLLERLALDTVTVAEEGNRRAQVIDLLDGVPDDLAAARRTERAVLVLRTKVVDASENKRVQGVDLVVTTRWASVSKAMAEQLVAALNEFNLVARKSQAAEERRFAEAQTAEAERGLRAAEDQMAQFQLRNRVATSPNLKFEEDRLQRELNLRQAVYTSLVQSREDARLREVRDTPVITVLKSPWLAATPKPRRLVLKAALGLVAGVLLAVLLGYAAEAMGAARASTRKETRELIAQVDEATPKWLRSSSRSN